MCRLFFAFQTNHAKKKLHVFLKQTHRRNKNTPGLDTTHDDITVKDGFGIAYMGPRNKKWHVYKKPTTYNKDDHLATKIDTIPDHFILGHLRGITVHGPNDLRKVNTHPFQYENNVFLHNGYIRHFRDHMDQLYAFILPKYLPHILGETDSELLFFMYLSAIDKTCGHDPVVAMRALMKYIDDLDVFFIGNMIFSNDRFSIITRYVNDPNDEPPALYMDTSDGGVLITSEPVTKNYQLLPRNEILFIE